MLEVPKLTLRLSKDNHKILSDLKEETGLSINKIVNLLISKQNDTSYMKNLKNHKLGEDEKKEVRLKITENEYDFLKNEAQKDGINHVNNEVKYRLLNTIYRNKYFTNIELSTFIKTKGEINTIGRNLNQLLKLLHTKSNLTVHDEVFKNMVSDIDNNVKNISNDLRDIIEKSRSRY
jgi:hypothetical protein